VKPCLTELKYDDFMIGIQKLLQFWTK
jgi:hypothetical protein